MKQVRKYNQLIADETIEDYSLRYAPKSFRKFSEILIANTAIGSISFLALEAIGAGIGIEYGFATAFWAILTASLIIFFTAGILCLNRYAPTSVIESISIFLLVLTSLALIASSAECDTRSLRVQRNIPQSIFKRFLIFPFFQGRLNGILWSLGWMLIFTTIYLSAKILQEYTHSRSIYSIIEDDIIGLQSIIFYTISYTLAGIFIQRKLLKRWYKTGITPAIILILLLITTGIPYLYAFFTQELSHLDRIWSPLSPIDPDYDLHETSHVAAAFIGSILGIIINLPLFTKSIRSFKPIEKNTDISTAATKLNNDTENNITDDC